MDKNRFARFEQRIQTLIEGGFSRLFAGRLRPREVALRLAHAMEDGVDLDDTGSLTAPNRYRVHMHPDDHAVLLAAQPDLAALLARHAVSLANESDLRLEVPPDVILVADPAVALHEVEIRAEHAGVLRKTTQLLPLPGSDEAAAQFAIPAAYIVVGGSRYVPLERPVINIGRRRDNAIVLDDPRVSRQHCQLRLRFGKFVLYDLGSRGGTYLNGARVSESVLRPGDVISLAGVQVVYVEDDSGTETHRPGGGDTQIYHRRVDESGDADEDERD